MIMQQTMFKHSTETHTYHAVIGKSEQNETWYSWFVIHDGRVWLHGDMQPAASRFDAISRAFVIFARKALGMRLHPCRAWMLYEEWQLGTDCYHFLGGQIIFMRRTCNNLYSLYVLSPRDGKFYNYHVEYGTELYFDDVTDCD